VHSDEIGVSSEDVGVAVRVALGRRQHGAAGRADGVVEREVVTLRRALGELHVVDDPPHAVGVQAGDHAPVERAAKRPRTELADRLVIDAHDHDVRRRRHRAQLEPRRETRALERVERSGQLAEPAESRGGDGSENERGDPSSADDATRHGRATQRPADHPACAGLPRPT
jgi:hypothetical protein